MRSRSKNIFVNIYFKYQLETSFEKYCRTNAFSSRHFIFVNPIEFSVITVFNRWFISLASNVGHRILNSILLNCKSKIGNRIKPFKNISDVIICKKIVHQLKIIENDISYFLFNVCLFAPLNPMWRHITSASVKSQFVSATGSPLMKTSPELQFPPARQ